MNLFETAKQNITVKQAAERYGLLTKPNGLLLCPFHDDHEPSLKLNDDYFYCFGCHASGDVVDFTARLFGLSSLNAARKLMSDFGLTQDAASAPSPNVQTIRRDFLKRERHALRVLEAYEALLADWKIRYAPKSRTEDPDERFVDACQLLDYTGFLINTLSFGKRDDRANALETLEKQGIIDGLERILKRNREEEERLENP